MSHHGAVRTRSRLVAWLPRAALGLAVGLLFGSFLPWLRSGTRDRNSYAVVDAADALGVLDNWGGSTSARIWYCLPLLVAFVAAAFVAGRHRLLALSSFVAGALGVVGGLATYRSPLAPRYGLTAALIASVGLVIVASALGLLDYRQHRVTQTHRR